jgi:putative ABC transport system permease protein
MIEAGSDVKALEEKFPVFVQKYFGDIIKRRQDSGYLPKESDAFMLRLQPLLDVHLNTNVTSAPRGEAGNPAYSLILTAIGILVLTVACINFVTLAIGRSAYRAREVGMRKVLGAIRSQLISQFWGEAFFLCTAALLVGLVLAELLLPMFNQLSQKELTLDILSEGSLLIGLTAMLLLIGAAAGSYPAVFLSRFTPTETLKGQFKLGGKNLFTKVLVVFQFGLSVFLICGAIVLSSQIDHLITRNLGFNAEQVVVLPMHAGNPENGQRLADRFRTRVTENPSITNISVTSGAFTQGYDIEGFKYRGEKKSSFLYRVDEDYLATLRIPLKHGRNFTKGSVDDVETGMIVNEAFLRSMGWPEPGLGNSLAESDSKAFQHYKVIGVVPDFHFTSLRNEIRPVMMFMNPEWPLDALLIRITASNVPETMEYLRQVWREIVPDNPFNATFLDEDFRKQYDEEMRWSRIVTFGSSAGLTLACLGLFGLVTLSIAGRTKEIGIRKVLGASGPGVVRLISKDFLKLVAWANALAWPLAYLAATEYLENYAYRITLTPTIFIAAGLGVLVIAFLAIIVQIVKAVRANPVDALRYE